MSRTSSLREPDGPPASPFDRVKPGKLELSRRWQPKVGWVAEWSKAAVLKTAEGASPPQVRILSHPLQNTVVLVETTPDTAVFWAKPEDGRHNADQPSAGLRVLKNGLFYFGKGDGSLAEIR